MNVQARTFVAVLAAGLVLHLALNAGRPMTVQDAMLALSCASEQPDLGAVFDFASITTTPPLYPALLWLQTRCAGLSPGSLRLPGTLALLLGGAFLAATLAARERRLPALLCGFLVACGAYPVALSGMVRSYPLLCGEACVYAALLLSWGAATPARSVLLTLLCVALAHTQYLAPFLMAGGCLGMLLFRPKEGLRSWLACHAAAGLLSLPWYAWGLPRQLALGMTAWHGTAAPLNVWMEFAWTPFRFFFMSLRPQSVWAAAAAATGIALLYLRGATSLRKAPAEENRVAVSLIAGYLGVILYSLYKRHPYAGFHYLAPFFPLAVLWIGFSVSGLPGRLPKAALALLVALSVLTARPPREDGPWQRLADWMAPRLGPDAVLLSPNYYSERSELLDLTLRQRHGLVLEILPTSLGDPFFNYRRPGRTLPESGEPEVLRNWARDSARGRPVWRIVHGDHRADLDGLQVEVLLSPGGEWAAAKIP